jgi:hypothetical protein
MPDDAPSPTGGTLSPPTDTLSPAAGASSPTAGASSPTAGASSSAAAAKASTGLGQKRKSTRQETILMEQKKKEIDAENVEMQIQMDAAQARLNKKQKLFDTITSDTKKLDAQLSSARKKNKRRVESLDTSPKRPKFDVDPEHLSSLLSEKMDDLAKTFREDSKGTFEETMGVVEDTIIDSVSKKLDSIAGALKRVAPASKVDWSGIQKSMINAEKQMD